MRPEVTVREGGEVQSGHVPSGNGVRVEAGIVPFGIAELDGSCEGEKGDGGDWGHGVQILLHDRLGRQPRLAQGQPGLLPEIDAGQ